MIRYLKEGVEIPKELEVEKGYMAKTVAELKAIAKELGIELPEKVTKAEIVKALSDTQE